MHVKMYTHVYIPVGNMQIVTNVNMYCIYDICIYIYICMPERIAYGFGTAMVLPTGPSTPSMNLGFSSSNFPQRYFGRRQEALVDSKFNSLNSLWVSRWCLFFRKTCCELWIWLLRRVFSSSNSLKSITHSRPYATICNHLQPFAIIISWAIILPIYPQEPIYEKLKHQNYRKPKKEVSRTTLDSGLVVKSFFSSCRFFDPLPRLSERCLSWMCWCAGTCPQASGRSLVMPKPEEALWCPNLLPAVRKCIIFVCLPSQLICATHNMLHHMIRINLD